MIGNSTNMGDDDDDDDSSVFVVISLSASVIVAALVSAVVSSISNESPSSQEDTIAWHCKVDYIIDDYCFIFIIGIGVVFDNDVPSVLVWVVDSLMPIIVIIVMILSSIFPIYALLYLALVERVFFNK